VPKPRAILKRRKSIQNIAKITKTMKMIAQAKFKRAFDRAVAARPYTDRLTALVGELSRAAGTDFTHPLLEPREGARIAMLAVASNRGLCGGYNSGVARATIEAHRAAVAEGKEVQLVVVGRRVTSALRVAGITPERTITTFDDRPTLEQAREAVAPLVEAYAQGRVTEVRLAYMRFESASRQFPVVETVLPFPVPTPAPGEKAPVERDWIFDPSPAAILTDLIPRAVRLRFFQAFLDASVAEQVARMAAMSAATDNAQDMIVSLGRLFNRSRQAQITTELSEIMGGAAALE
jgi:F-type H+-transporting ATPase subunit gamma